MLRDNILLIGVLEPKLTKDQPEVTSDPKFTSKVNTKLVDSEKYAHIKYVDLKLT